MKTKQTVLAIAAALTLGMAASSDPLAAQTLYGWQLMTPREWAAHRNTMRTLPPAERSTYRARHHEEMQKRAAAQGLTLPDEPLFQGAGRRGGGRGPGPGYGFPGPRGCWRR